jgi:predicted dehydrogenase
MTNGVHAVDRTSWILGAPLRLKSASLQQVAPRRHSEDYAALTLHSTETIGPRGNQQPTRVEITLLWSEYQPPISRLQVIGTSGAGWADSSGKWAVHGLRGERTGQGDPTRTNHGRQWLAFRSLVDAKLAADPAEPSADLAPLADLKPVMEVLASALQADAKDLRGCSQAAPDPPRRKQ